MLETVTEHQEFTGQTVAKETIEIRARVSGYLEATPFKDGDLVDAEQEIFKIDPRPYKAESERTAAALEQVKAHLERLKKQKERALKLLEKKALSQEDFDTASFDFEEATASVEAARASHETAKLNLSFTTINATIKGRISRRLVDPGNLVQADVTPLTIDQMIVLANKFLGVTYTWGGSSSFGFDCSGFTQMLQLQRGVIMPRDADLQAAWGGVIAVERKDLQPGDLLFFGESAGHITHTGMYIGNGEFIHDTTHEHPGVQVSKLDDAPWTSLLVAARRAKS